METKEATTASTSPLPANGTAPLAKVDDTPKPNPFAPVVWNQERVDLVKKQICPKGITDDELAVFLLQCKRTELDPLIKEAFCVPRRMNVGTKLREEWVTRNEFQPAEAGMAARADRFPDYRGVTFAAVYEKDDFTIDPEACVVHHKYSPNKDRGRLVGAWAQVHREGRKISPDYVPLSERTQQTSQWAKAETMIVKCARAAAWRRAYPNTFGGLYLEEEYAAAEVEVNPPPSNGAAPATSRTQSVTDKAKAAAEAAKGGTPAASKPAGQSTVDAPKSSPPKAAPKPREGELTMGPSKGKLPAELSADELTNAITTHETKLKEQPVAKWAGRAQFELDLLQAEQKKRLAAAEAPADREPGSDDGDDSAAPF